MGQKLNLEGRKGVIVRVRRKDGTKAEMLKKKKLKNGPSVIIGMKKVRVDADGKMRDFITDNLWLCLFVSCKVRGKVIQ